MGKVFLIFFSLLFIFFTQTIYAQEERTVTVQPIRKVAKDKRWALIIGIDKYQDSNITSLAGADNDARALRDALIRYANFDTEQIIIMTSDAASNLQPSRANILERLSSLRTIVPSDGFLLISYSGHGIERNGKAYLLPMDVKGLNDPLLLEDTAIPISRLKDTIKITGVKQVLLFIDACRNDPAGGKGDIDNRLTQTFADAALLNERNKDIEVYATLYSCRVGERAYEYQGKKQGFFSYYLVKGLEGEAVDGNGDVTLGELKKYLETKVPRAVQLELGAKQQTPYAQIEGTGAERFVLAAKVSTKVEQPAIRSVISPERVYEYGTLTIISERQDMEISLDGTVVGKSKAAGEKIIFKQQIAGRKVEIKAKLADKPEIIKYAEIRANEDVIVKLGLTPTIVGELRRFLGHEEDVLAVSFSPDGRMAVSGSGFDGTKLSNDNEIRLWDVVMAKEVLRFKGHKGAVMSIAFSPDGRRLASGSRGFFYANTLFIWDVATGKPIHLLPTGKEQIYSVDWSKDGRYLATGSRGLFGNNPVRLWDTETGKEIRRFTGHKQEVRSAIFSPNGEFILSGGGDGLLRLWDLNTSKEVRVFKGHTADVMAVAFSPDGQSIISGSADKTIRLWDTNTGKEIRVFKGHTDQVKSIAFSPNRQRILSGSWDSTIILWEVATGKQIHRFVEHNGGVHSVAFSPDGQQILSGGLDKTMRLWQLPD